MTSVSNTPELLTALRTANRGDGVTLAAGNYGDVALRGFKFATPVTLDCQPGAVMNSASILQCEGITLETPTLRFAPTATTNAFASILTVNASPGVTVQGGSIMGAPAINGVPATAKALDATGNVIGFPTPNGVAIIKSPNAALSGVEISQVNAGVVLQGSPGLLIETCNIHDVRTCPIHGGADDNMTIRGNDLGPCHPWGWPPVKGGADDHADMIHLWTVAGSTAPCVGLVIENNTALQGDGQAVLGIYLCEHSADNGAGGFQGAIVRGNRLALDQYQAIRIDHGTGAIVQGNTLTAWTLGFAKAAHVILAYGSTGCNVTGNACRGVSFSAGMTAAQIATNVITPNGA